jgi:hypothetical protein
MDEIEASGASNKPNKKYYVLCLSESTRFEFSFDSREEIMKVMSEHIEEHNKLIDDPLLQLNIEDFEIIEEDA